VFESWAEHADSNFNNFADGQILAYLDFSNFIVQAAVL
jgi:hypothetical protein